MDFRGYLKKEIVIKDPVSTEYEAARLLSENQAKTLFFEKVEGYDFPIAGNVCPTRERLCEALGTTREGYIGRVTKAVGSPIAPETLDVAPCQEKELKSVLELPVLRHFERDAGRYICSGILVAEDGGGRRNVSIHRLLVLGERRLGIRLVERHLYTYHKEAEERGEPLDVAVAVGVHPAVFFSAAYPLPRGQDEFALASSLIGKPLKLVKCRTNALEVPAHSEFVIEGRLLPRESADEGPFGDITGTYDIVRKQPVLEVSKITHRENAIYHALFPTGSEHQVFMGMPQEPKIYGAVGKVAEVKNACLTDGGKNWLHGVVSIDKKRDEEGKEAINAALDAHPSMKHVVVVDGDIDIFNPEEVEFAIATRFQADRDMVIRKHVKGSSLDPSAGENSITTKLGLDATMTMKRKKVFEPVEIPRG